MHKSRSSGKRKNSGSAVARKPAETGKSTISTAKAAEQAPAEVVDNLKGIWMTRPREGVFAFERSQKAGRIFIMYAAGAALVAVYLLWMGLTAKANSAAASLTYLAIPFLILAGAFVWTSGGGYALEVDSVDRTYALTLRRFSKSTTETGAVRDLEILLLAASFTSSLSIGSTNAKWRIPVSEEYRLSYTAEDRADALAEITGIARKKAR